MIKKVLIVDDNSANLYMLETLLKGYGLEVTSAENGKDALDKARLNPPDLIVTDILMPVMDGYALCRQWKSDDNLKHIPLVFYTATYTEPKDEKFALSLGADHFILKPQEPDIFMDMLKKVLGEKYTARQVVTKPLGEEMEFFRKHNEILFKKLETKMSDLEIANQNLRILEEKYRLSFEHVMDVIYTIDTDLILLSLSPSVERILGYKPQDFIGRPVSDLGNILTPESFEQAIADISFILKGETISATIYQFIAKDGTIKYGEVSGSPLMREGKIIGIISVARDITERKQAEETLKESENKYRLLADNVNDVIFVLDMNLNYTYVSPSVKMLRGYEPEEVLKLQSSETLTPASWELTMRTLSEVIALEKSGRREEFPPYRTLQLEMVRKDGTTVWTEVKFSFIRDENQRPVAILGVTRDITDRKRVEDALMESEKKYRELYDFLPIPVYEMDFETKITSANHAIYEVFRGTEEDLKKGIKVWQLLSPEDIEKSRKNIERLLSGEQIVGTEYTLKRLDETVFPAIVISSVIYSNNKPVGLRGAIIDITERKQSEATFRESEARFRSYFELPLIGIAISSPEKGWIEVNNRLSDILGYSVEELKGMSWSELTYPEDLDADVKQFNRVLAGEIDSYMIDKRFIRKGGEVIWTSLAAGCVRKQDGMVDYFVVLIEDITVRKQAEDALRESEEKYRNILEDMDDVYFEVDIKGNITFVNRSSCKMSGYSEEELLGMPFKKISVADSIEMVMQYFGEIFLTGKTGKPFLWNLEKKNGEQGFFEIVASLIRDKRGKPIGFRGIGRDITERKRAEDKLQQTLESLKKAVGTTIQVLVSAVESRDPYTAGHQLRVADLARIIATEMGLPHDTIEGIRMAGSIHDIGKLSIPAEILSKPTKLTNTEFSLIKEHPQSGFEMLKDVESPWPLAQIVYQHHERMNGSGYPRNLKGNDILLEARIMAVADVVEAMASHRPYRPALGIDVALEEIEKNKGIIYDDTVADACLRLFREKGYQLT